jgi:hypothetical protein
MIFPLPKKNVTVIGSLLLLAARAAVLAQEPSLEELLPGLKERAVVLDITARVVEQDQQEVWNSFNSKVTIPGRPVGLKLVGANVIVAVQFTPYLRADGNNVLVAQGQIWIDIPDKGMHYQTTMQAIPLEFEEQIYFFPLGALSEGGARIEILLVLHPYPAGAQNAGQGGAPGESGAKPETASQGNTEGNSGPQ